MANLDSPLKRFSGHQVMMPWRGIASLPDGTVAARDRQVVAFLYSGILADAPATIATITGTIFGATEADIVAGGRTIVITLQYDTWVAAGGTFDAQRQNILDGITTTFSLLMLNQPVTTVVRTSDTVATITLDADATYDITADDTGTVTVPSSALVNSLVDVGGTPTFTITYVPIPDQDDLGASGGNLRRRKKKRVIRFSDFETKEQQAEAVMRAIPLSRISDEGRIIDEDESEDDDVLIHAILAITLH